jgi:hypothetical protein
MRFLPVLFICASLHGAATGRLEGTVRDSSDGVMPGASISCMQEETGFRFSGRADFQGNYRMLVPEGHYKVLASQAGFRGVAEIGVFVASGRTQRVDFRLAPEGVSDAATVSDSTTEIPSVFEEEDGAIVVRPDAPSGLPQNDRTVTGWMQLTPGMLTTPASGGEPGQISSLGARPNTNRYTVDGVSANNAVAGGGWPSVLPGARLPSMTALGTTHDLALPDAIAEIRVMPQALLPESGRAPGGNISIRTRTGTNQFHGSLFYAGSPPSWGANDWFSNRYDLEASAPKLADRGGSLGGPLRRDRTFFFISAERLDLRQTYSWTTTVPSLAWRALAPPNILILLDLFPLPNGPPLNSFGLGELIGSSVRPNALWGVNSRLDHALTAHTRAFLRTNVTPSWSDAGLTQVDNSSYRNSNGVLGVTHDTALGIEDARVSFSRTVASSQWSPPAGSEASGAFYSQYPSFAAEFSTISIGGAGSVQAGESGRTSQDQIQMSEGFSRQTGRHDLRFGADYLQLRPIRGGPSSNWDVAFSSPTNLISEQAAPVWVTYSQIQTSATRLHQFSGYAQDTWKIHPLLTVTAGLRALAMLPPVAARGSSLYSVAESSSGVSFNPVPSGTPLWQGNILKLDPVLSVAWRLSPHGSTVLRASWASFHDGDFAVATDQLNGSPYLSLRAEEGSEIVSWGSPLLPVQLGYGFASNLRIPVYRRWGVTLQQAWTHSDSIALSYSGMTGSGLLRRDTYFNPNAVIEATGLGQLQYATNDGTSSYNGFYAIYKRTLGNGLQSNLSYSWSHSIDRGSSDSLLYLFLPGNQGGSDRGDSDFDVRHTLNLSLTYTTPDLKFFGRFPGRWTLATYTYARTGFPMDVLLSETLDGSAVSNYRPDRVSGVPLWLNDSSVPGGRRLNPAAFATPSGLVGDLGRNSIRGFGEWQSDVAAERPFRVNDAIKLTFRAEAYNVFNHAQFADPVRFLSNPLFGVSESPLNLMLGTGSPVSGQAPAFQMGGPRSLRLSLRVSF